MPKEMYEEEPMAVPPEQISELGRTMDETIANDVEALTPTGVFSVGALNSLVDGLNKVLPMFELPAYPTFDEDIEGPLPEEFVRQLAMVNEAAVAAGHEPFPFEEAVDDTGLKMMAGRLDGLSKDKDFKKFLDEQISLLKEEDFAEEEQVEEIVEETPSGEIDEEELFMERI